MLGGKDAKLDDVLEESTASADLRMDHGSGRCGATIDFNLFVHGVGSINAVQFDMDVTRITSERESYRMTSKLPYPPVKRIRNRKTAFMPF